MFGASSAYQTPSTTPAFGSSSTSLFGSTPSPTPAFGATPSTPAFGSSPFSTPGFGATPTSTPAFGTPSTASIFATPSPTPAFGSSTPAFGAGFGSSLFSTPLSQQQQQQQPTASFQTPTQSQSLLGTPQQQNTPFSNVQLTTQMAPVAPLPFSFAERDIQAIVEAYKDDATNSKYAFKHLLFSVTDQQLRIKPAGVSDIMWAEAMGKLEGMDSSSRERLWPQLTQGFKDLSHRLKLQDEVIVSDIDRLRMTQSNVKMLQRHFQADTLPRIERLRQREQDLQRRLLRVMRIVEGLEGKGCRLPLMKGEVELAEKLAAITRQLKGSGEELSRRVQNLLTISRIQANPDGVTVSVYLPSSAKIQQRSLSDMQEVLQRQTEAIAKLGNVLKRDIRDMEIIMAEDSEMTDDAS